MTAELTRRIYGLETEYGVTCASPDGRGLSADEVARYLFRKVVAWGRSSNVFLRNGSRLYLDVGSHPEYATAECSTLDELIASDGAGDLLLHDLGEALADGREDYQATGTEWRTPPLWGLGLTATVNGHTRLLHDGRARTVLEAILWHGGEAKASREAVQRMSPKERAALLTFLDSL